MTTPILKTKPRKVACNFMIITMKNNKHIYRENPKHINPQFFKTKKICNSEKSIMNIK